jgi:uncharacterized protein (DUF1330 family)
MGAEPRGHVTLVGLQVTDDAKYTRYREEMAPILARHGGGFGCDFAVARVLLGPDARINRVFTLVFPDRVGREQFFADEEYRAVRKSWFEPSVGAVDILVEAVLDAS